MCAIADSWFHPFHSYRYDIFHAWLKQAAALALDASILDADQVEALIKNCPTKEDVELLKVKL